MGKGGRASGGRCGRRMSVYLRSLRGVAGRAKGGGAVDDELCGVRGVVVDARVHLGRVRIEAETVKDLHVCDSAPARQRGHGCWTVEPEHVTEQNAHPLWILLSFPQFRWPPGVCQKELRSQTS